MYDKDVRAMAERMVEVAYVADMDDRSQIDDADYSIIATNAQTLLDAGFGQALMALKRVQYDGRKGEYTSQMDTYVGDALNNLRGFESA